MNIIIDFNQLEDKSLSQAQKDSINAQVAFKEQKILSINSELKEVESLDADMKALEAVGVRADKAAAAKEKLEAELEEAEEKNDLAAQKFLKEQIKIQTDVFDKAETEYATKSEELRVKAQKTNAELMEKSTSWFDKIATGGGFLIINL